MLLAEIERVGNSAVQLELHGASQVCKNCLTLFTALLPYFYHYRALLRAHPFFCAVLSSDRVSLMQSQSFKNFEATVMN